MAPLSLIEVCEREMLAAAFAVRRRVFVDEQGVDASLEIDQREGEARHLLALRHGAPVGTLRIRFIEGGRIAKIERVAVLAEARGAGVGEALLGRALELAEAAGAGSAILHAQVQVQAFYKKLGFATEGPVFIEDGLPHVAMTRGLPAGTAAA